MGWVIQQINIKIPLPNITVDSVNNLYSLSDRLTHTLTHRGNFKE